MTRLTGVGNHTMLGLLDLSAAFDTVVHDERLSRTYAVSARPRLIDFAPLYANVDTVLFNGMLSTVSLSPVVSLIGSMLGPVLFIFYTTNLGELAVSLVL